MKATAIAPSNIAFIKYWGKADPATRVPQNNSISMNLSDLYTTTTVQFDASNKKDSIMFIDEGVVKKDELVKITGALDRIRFYSGSRLFARVVTKNNFPKATGIASSASGFAALTVAAFSALGKDTSDKDEVSRLARQFSGTACRSVPDGFVEWEKGHDSESSYATQIFPSYWWDIRDVVAIVTEEMKAVGSTEGHAIANTSGLYETRLASIDAKIYAIKDAMRRRDFSAFGRILEEDSFNMHGVALTSNPPLVYWEPQTIAIIKTVFQLRASGNAEAYVTIDAGPTVHVICQANDEKKIVEKLNGVQGILRVVSNRPARGAHLTEDHLF
ncbi:diphosphomevalonate decarboxylase [Candidatus Gottesmanbacteria bacterium]|nr:diphosphomevalonate decarboxylase [Candidatus Gottesmanbacteria bacterium]